MVISVCGPIGYEKARALYDENMEMLNERFATFFLRQFEEIEKTIVPKPLSFDGFCIELKERGLYGALWEAGEALECGMKVALNAIPLRQEVVEILELFDESPYECASGGSWLIVSDRNETEISFAGQKIPLTMIGITTDDRARIIEGEVQIRYLTPPRRQDKDMEDLKKGRSFLQKGLL